MQIKQTRPTEVQLTIHSFALATLISTARWVAEGCAGELPPAAVAQIQQVIADYDRARQPEAQPRQHAV